MDNKNSTFELNAPLDLHTPLPPFDNTSHEGSISVAVIVAISCLISLLIEKIIKLIETLKS